MGVQLGDGALYPAKIISRDQCSIDGWYVQMMSGGSPGEKIVQASADEIQRCKPLLYSKRHIRQAIRVLTVPKASYLEPFCIRPEYEAFLKIASEQAADLAAFISDFIVNYTAVKKQKKLDAFFAPMPPSALQKPQVERPPFSEGLGIPPSLNWPLLQSWIFFVSFAGPLHIYPFKLAEWEYALAAPRDPEHSNPIMSVVIMKLLKALLKERHDSGKQSLISLCSRLLVDGREFDSGVLEQSTEPLKIPKWHTDKLTHSNWPLMLGSFLSEVTAGAALSFDWYALTLSKRVQLVRLLQEMILALPLCKKTVDDWMSKGAENRKLKRHSEAERKRLARDLDKQPAPTTPEEKKAQRAMQRELEQLERTLAACDSDTFKWDCYRLEPIGKDSDGFQYWIVDYWGPNVYCGDAGRLYCCDEGRRPGSWGYWNRPDQIEALVAALEKSKAKGAENVELKEALVEDYWEYLNTGMNKYCYAAVASVPEPGLEPVKKGAGGRRAILLDPGQSWLKYSNKWD